MSAQLSLWLLLLSVSIVTSDMTATLVQNLKSCVDEVVQTFPKLNNVNTVRGLMGPCIRKHYPDAPDIVVDILLDGLVKHGDHDATKLAYFIKNKVKGVSFALNCLKKFLPRYLIDVNTQDDFRLSDTDTNVASCFLSKPTADQLAKAVKFINDGLASNRKYNYNLIDRVVADYKKDLERSQRRAIN